MDPLGCDKRLQGVVMKVGDLVQSKHPNVYGDGFGIVVAAYRPPSVTGTPRPPRFNVRWDNGETSHHVPAIELEKVA